MVWQAGLLDSLGEESRQHKRGKSVQGKFSKGVGGDKKIKIIMLLHAFSLMYIHCCMVT